VLYVCVQALADAYPSVVFLMLWGNINDASKKLFRDRLKVGEEGIRAGGGGGKVELESRGGAGMCVWGGGGRGEKQGQDFLRAGWQHATGAARSRCSRFLCPHTPMHASSNILQEQLPMSVSFRAPCFSSCLRVRTFCTHCLWRCAAC
jgi:hypothetical protein